MLIPIRKFRVLRIAVFVVSVLLVTRPSLAENIYFELGTHLQEVIDTLNERNLKTVGFLKFRIQKDGDPASDKVGPLNFLLADRLETAMVLHNPFDETALEIIGDANAQAAKIQGANHLTKEGRAVFFNESFRLAWGEESRPADAFITGVLQVSSDLKTARMGLLYFDRSGSGLQKLIEPFEGDLDAATIQELGESFILRGAFDDGQTVKTTAAPKIREQQEQQQQQETQILNEANRVKTQLTVFPLQDSAAPVTLEIRYDGKRVPVQIRDGAAFVREPGAGTKVEFAIQRAAFVNGTIGVVLKVNGENTLFRQTNRDLDCAKWLLTPEHTRTVIKGYQMPDTSKAEEFKVLNLVDSFTREVDYGRSLGQIQLTVFRQQTETPPPTLDEADEDLAALLRAVRPVLPPKNADALKSQLRAAVRNSGESSRGLIVPGSETQSAIDLKTFEPDPTPIMSITINYYKTDVN